MLHPGQYMGMRPTFSESLPLIAFLAVLIVAAIFLAASEAALLRVRRSRVVVLAEQGDRSARRVLALIDDLPRVMNTVLLIVLLTQIGSATVTGFLAERHFGNAGVTVASVLLTFVMFVYAEAIPKTVAVRHPVTVARFVAVPIEAIVWLMRPFVTVLLKFADLQAPGKGIAVPVGVTEAELRHLAAEAQAAGQIAESDLELIERAFAAGDEKVGALVVPRLEVVAIAAETPLRAAFDLALDSGHRRLPIYGESLDDITGSVRWRDLARAVTDGADVGLADLAVPVLIVPESGRAIDVLRDMQSTAQHLAVVIDEHGGTAGIVTIEDLVEEIVGEISDEDRAATPLIHRIDEGRWLVEGTAEIDELEAALGTTLPAGDWVTVAGLVLAVAGKIPAEGDRFPIAGHTFRVVAASRRRVRRLEVTRKTGS
jgi:CBS domain containing-hemolysin-like protein